MKKITLLSMISLLSCSSLVHAGGMGDSNFCCSAFVSLEGGYSWNSIDGYHFDLIGANTTIFSQTTRQQYTGRLAAGMISLVDDQIGVTGELGWGYYGRTSLNPNPPGLFSQIPASLSTKYTISGFDALLGVAYVQPSFNLSIKAGALIQNMQTQGSASFTTFDFAPLVTVNSVSSRTNTTAVLPEVKLGAGYNFDSNWSVTAAFLIALGSTPKTAGSLNLTNLSTSLAVNAQNPTVSALLVGVQYTF